MFHMSRSYSMVNSSKSRPLRSAVWKYIKIVGEKKVQCKLYVPPATTTYFSLSWWNHIYVKPLYEPHPDKYDESGKESHSQCRLDSFVHAKKYSAEYAEEITRRIAEIVARDLWPITIVEGMISSIF